MEQLVRMFTLLSSVLCFYVELMMMMMMMMTTMIRVHSFSYPYSKFLVLYAPSHSEFL